MAARRHSWQSWHEVKKACAVPQKHQLWWNRVEVSLADLMSHSTGRILEYLYEMEPSVMADLTKAEKMSLEL